MLLSSLPFTSWRLEKATATRKDLHHSLNKEFKHGCQSLFSSLTILGSRCKRGQSSSSCRLHWSSVALGSCMGHLAVSSFGISSHMSVFSPPPSFWSSLTTLEILHRESSINCPQVVLPFDEVSRTRNWSSSRRHQHLSSSQRVQDLQASR